ncbi:flotillin family protein [Arthrobacter sp. zg-Y1110]|uniref:SPFH domain-containing protein n=1 Tax=Arthrobacter sp. zg-Y1110 TaxID=2886932 RepID=UPI001D15A21F|nr:flotillin family protein [Arthrobacter sp. zg-Y1110]MCC3292831.1 flotillin family protein [Arthrobacter sp. zg-Y1110]UWX86770.1 SPFH domain-containing protein [Arthrobacter sp. zg-Y1110]
MGFENTGSVLAVVAIIVVFLAILGYAASRLRTVAPDEVLVIVRMGSTKSGTGGVRDSSNDTIAFAGKVLVLPVVQQDFRLSLKQRQVELTVTGPDKNFINVSVLASLNFKLADSEADIRKSAQRFLTHTDAQLETSIQNSLEGSLRSIIGSMTVQEINSDRAKFMDAVLNTAKAELAEQGIQVDILNIKDIKTNDKDYWDNLSKPETERAAQVAAVAASEAKQIREAARVAQEEQTARLDKDLAVKQAAFKAEEDTQQAIADAAKDLAKAQQDVEIARLQRAALVEEALVQEQKLDISEKKPADAAAYAARVHAEGLRDAAKADTEGRAFEKRTMAEAEKAATVLEASARAESLELEATAEAKAVELKGEAEGKSIKAIGTANAEAEKAKADALAGYTEEAIAYILADHMPSIMAANARAVAGIDNYTVISTDGASDATKQVTRMGTEGLASIKAMTGIDLSALLGNLAGGAIAGNAAVSAADTPEQAKAA